MTRKVSTARARGSRPQTVAAKEPSLPVRATVPIVGIGASAGGLEALDQFLARVPVGSGLAFVIVQHLAPTQKGVMPQLLQRVTGMPVTQVTDHTPIRPNCVYVIPPNRDLSILRGVLYLLTPTARPGLRLPIDFFFRSLAQEQREHSVGVILSGMGSDGTLGLRAIKEQAGVAFVQDPATAKFDSMPRSAIDAGLADIVAPAEELPAKILGYVQRTLLIPRPEGAPEGITQNALEKVILLLRAHTGNDFSCYKRNTLYRRIDRRMGIHQIDTMATYVRYLRENSQELSLLFKELLIGVTHFFRDANLWQDLATEILPILKAKGALRQTVRAWVPGCSTGEEAYSLAMVLKEAADELKTDATLAIQVFATDLDRDAIDKARQGLYPLNIAADVSEARLKRFFTKTGQGYRVCNAIRELVVFATQNLIMDPPFTKLDLLSCRNLLIYLNSESQKKLIPLFHYSLNPGGLLILGNAETTGDSSHFFSQVNVKSRLYRRAKSESRPELITFPSSLLDTPAAEPKPAGPLRHTPGFQEAADLFVLQHYAPSAVVTNEQGDIFYVSGRTGKYLEPAAGKANWNLFAMARDGLRLELTNAFPRVIRLGKPVTLLGIKVQMDSGLQWVNVTVQRISEPGQLLGLVIVVFTDIPAPMPTPRTSGRIKPSAESSRSAELEQELLRVRGEARAALEEMQTAQEELRSANEELQSTNEELQSANEEFTTSKEEMQSMNEEMQTVNTELQVKVDEFSRVSDDMKNLLDSTDIATLFLDNVLNVRRFTPQATKIFKLIPGDAGRPITDLASGLRYPELADDAREVLRKLISAEKTIGARDGRWFTVRIMPYRTLDDRIDGVVITFVDITAAKTLEAKLRGRHAGLAQGATARAGKRFKASKRRSSLTIAFDTKAPRPAPPAGE